MKFLIFVMSVILSAQAFSSTCENVTNIIPELNIDPFRIQNNTFTGYVNSIPLNATRHAQRYETELNTFLRITRIEANVPENRRIHFQLTHTDQLVALLDRCISTQLNRMACNARRFSEKNTFVGIFVGATRPARSAWDDAYEKVQAYQQSRNKLSRTLSPTASWTPGLARESYGSSAQYLSSHGYSCARTPAAAINGGEQRTKDNGGRTGGAAPAGSRTRRE